MPDQQQAATEVFVVVIDDRHSDTDVEVWTDQAAVERRGRELVQECARHPEAVEEASLNDAMRADGWTFYQRYSPEGDNVRVMRRPVRAGALDAE